MFIFLYANIRFFLQLFTINQLKFYQAKTIVFLYIKKVIFQLFLLNLFANLFTTLSCHKALLWIKTFVLLLKV